MGWESPQKPAELTESRLIAAILDGTFPINTTLPAERELAEKLGVTRPTLREALQRLGRDGWLEIHQGKPTRVRNYWREGNLGLLNAISCNVELLPPDFVSQLLEVRVSLAPDYACLAVKRHPEAIVELLSGYSSLSEDPEAYAQADWQLHLQLTIASANPVYTLILNGFSDIYRLFGPLYFSDPANRSSSKTFYLALEKAAREREPQAARAVTLQVMKASLDAWLQIQSQSPGGES